MMPEIFKTLSNLGSYRIIHNQASMKPFQALVANGAVITLLGLWGYFASENPSPTALIPVVFGLLFLSAAPAMRRENKVIAHIVVVFTLLLLVALFMPFKGALGRGDSAGAFRVGLMMLATAVAMIVYIRSFIQARTGNPK